MAGASRNPSHSPACPRAAQARERRARRGRGGRKSRRRGNGQRSRGLCQRKGSLDRSRAPGVFNTVWRSAMHVDRWFGSTADESAYHETSGRSRPPCSTTSSTAFSPPAFQVDMPLPRMNERFTRSSGASIAMNTYRAHARIGRVRSPVRPGRGRRNPVRHSLSAAQTRRPFRSRCRAAPRAPAGSLRQGKLAIRRGTSETTLFSLRETAFWQNSEKFGIHQPRRHRTRASADAWLLRWTAPARSRSAPKACAATGRSMRIRGLSNRRAIGARTVQRRRVRC